MLNWEKDITVDQSVVYHFSTSHKGCLFDAWVASRNAPSPPASPDLVVLPVSPSSDDNQYVVEVKDFRNIRGIPGDKNIRNLADIFLAKIRTALLCFLGEHETLKLSSEDIGKWDNTRKTYFVLHIEMPVSGKAKDLASFPKGYPLNVLQKIRQQKPLTFLIGSSFKKPSFDPPWSYNLN